MRTQYLAWYSAALPNTTPTPPAPQPPPTPHPPTAEDMVVDRTREIVPGMVICGMEVGPRPPCTNAHLRLRLHLHPPSLHHTQRPPCTCACPHPQHPLCATPW